jgi:inosine-uridine nucleoside N-ribohydrolase
MKNPASDQSPQSVWLDTDIGDDTDDLLALALICASPELKLRGVSTVFGQTRARARLAQTFLAAAGGTLAGTPVSAGCGRELPYGMNTWMSPQPFWPNGPMRRAPIAQLACARPAKALPPIAPVHGVEALAAHLRKHPGKTIPIAIGALTNLATLLLRHPKLKNSIPRLIVMAGEFKTPKWEWNVRCDPVAAASVFDSGIPIEVIPWEIGMTCTINRKQLNDLFARRTPTGCLLARAVRLWRRAKYTPGHAAMPHLFDPMAVAVLLHPEWFAWRRGRVTVSFAPETFAYTRFVPDPKGPHRVAWSVRQASAVETVWSRILSG